MSKASKVAYKVAITETAAKTASKKSGGAAARFWGVIIIDKDSGEKRTAADMLNAAARKAALEHNATAGAMIRERVKAYGGAYRRSTAAIVAAAAYVEMNGGELAKSIAARLEEARAPGINAIAGCRVEKALIINNYGKPAARLFAVCRCGRWADEAYMEGLARYTRRLSLRFVRPSFPRIRV